MRDLQELYDIIAARKASPREGSYTNALLDHPEKAYRKLNEETYEVIHACLTGDRDQARYEAGDLLYHLLVILAKHDIPWREVLAELGARRK